MPKLLLVRREGGKLKVIFSKKEEKNITRERVIEGEKPFFSSGKRQY